MLLKPDDFDRKHGLDPNDPAYFWQRLSAMTKKQQRAAPVYIDEARQLADAGMLWYWSIYKAKLGYQLRFNRRLSDLASLSRMSIGPMPDGTTGIREDWPDPQSYKVLVYTETRRPVNFRTIADLYRAAVHDVGFPRLGTPPDHADEKKQLAEAIERQATKERDIPPDLEARKRLRTQPTVSNGRPSSGSSLPPSRPPAPADAPASDPPTQAPLFPPDES